jgi:uncharacterized protein YajQ (UPF0234 family)
MPSFDIASTVDIQTLDNAVNVVKKEITNRFDFKGIHVVIDLNKKDYMIKLEKETQFKADSLKNERLSLERQIKLLEAKNK